jgi:pimeloyl-ACP methyl ester carboxylesterase
MKRLTRWLGWIFFVLLVIVLAGVRRDRPAREVEARNASPPSQFMTVSGLRIHYRDRGHGPAVVLLHGSNASLFTWEGWASALAPEYRVITLDLPGHGLTGPDPLARYSAEQMATVVDAFVQKLGVTRFALAGNSMGGNVAWHYALAHPDKLDALILVDSAGYPRDEPPPFAFRIMSSPVLGYLARYVTPRFMVARSVHEVYADPSRVSDDLVERYYDLLLREGNREATRVRFSPRNNSEAAIRHIGEIRTPTLILWGARDRWILPKYAERFHADIPGSQLVVLDGLGHVPMEEDPARSLAPVKAFLEQHRAGGGKHAQQAP